MRRTGERRQQPFCPLPAPCVKQRRKLPEREAGRFRLLPVARTDSRAVRAVDSLRDDPLEVERIGTREHIGAAIDDVIRESDLTAILSDCLREQHFPIGQTSTGQILAVEPRQIEDMVDQALLGGCSTSVQSCGSRRVGIPLTELARLARTNAIS
jgi:hypothetical protein